MIKLLLLLALALSLTNSQFHEEKSIVMYLGTQFILLDGCPTNKCNDGDKDCQAKVETLRDRFAECSQSEEGQELGCLKDVINKRTQEEITVPVYANKCSAMCYERDPVSLARVIRCPHKGSREHSPELSQLF